MATDVDRHYAKGLARATLNAINALQYVDAHDLLTYGTAFYPPWVEKGPPLGLIEAQTALGMVRLATDRPEGFTSQAAAEQVRQESLNDAIRHLTAVYREPAYPRTKPRKASSRS